MSEMSSVDPAEIEAARLAAEVDAEREQELKKLHGVGSSDLEKEANAWLAAAGYTDLVSQTEALQEEYPEEYALSVNRADPADVEALVQRQERTGLVPYTPDAIAALTAPRLIRVINTMRAEQEEEQDPLTSALQMIQDTPATSEPKTKGQKMSTRQLAKGFGEHSEGEKEEAFDTLARATEREDEERNDFTFEGMLLQNLAERLTSPDFEERASALDALDELDKFGLQAILEGDPAILNVLIECAYEFSNDELRSTLLRIQSLREEQDEDI
ncbi:hypothetical protein HY468_02130 [Candidatus Roizmanbacteria bacterium]|nr:hypothetical protein [Candidatus Roizmanbacteria bacterium]